MNRVHFSTNRAHTPAFCSPAAHQQQTNKNALFLLFARKPETLLPDSSFFFFFTMLQVTTFSNDCLIRQTAVVTGPCGCCQACLCTTASAGEIYPVCFGTVATCFSLRADMHLHTFEKDSQKTNAAEAGTRPASRKYFFHRNIQYTTRFVFLYLFYFEGISTPHTYVNIGLYSNTWQQREHKLLPELMLHDLGLPGTRDSSGVCQTM